MAGFGLGYGLDRETALTLARGFGSGAGMGSLCGAVSGAIMVLGFQQRGGNDERKARYETYEAARAFRKAFEDRNRTVLCRDLLEGVDLGTEEGRRLAGEKGLFRRVCPKYVRDAAEILEGLLSREAS